MGRRVKWIGIAVALVAAVCTASAFAARVEYGNLVITADGGFRPERLPKHAFAPIRISGHSTITTKDGTTPPPLKTILFLVDGNGRLETRGLPVCEPKRLLNLTVTQARTTCHGAIVGTGRAKAILTSQDQTPTPATSPLTFFNGPRSGGDATVIIHAYTTTPAPVAYVATTTIQKIHIGRFGYAVSTDVPSIAGGNGSLVSGSLTIHRLYRYRGRLRSYIAARCSDGLLEARGKFTFADGTVISGTVFKPCWVR